MGVGVRAGELQGISEADVIWDLSGRKKEPAAPRAKRPNGKRAARHAAPEAGYAEARDLAVVS